MNNWEESVSKLHTIVGHRKAVIAISGGGTEVISELLRYGNGSSSLLEAIVPYDQNAFKDFVKEIQSPSMEPNKFCSMGAAKDLAKAAYLRAVKLSSNKSVVGVGATCSLRKAGVERAGREHNVYVCYVNDRDMGQYHYAITDSQSRQEEETFAATKIFNALLMGSDCYREVKELFLDYSLPSRLNSFECPVEN